LKVLTGAGAQIDTTTGCRRSDGGDRGLAPQISGLADTTSGAPGVDGLDGQALLNPQRSTELIEEMRAVGLPL
jgi:hypothetical protein